MSDPLSIAGGVVGIVSLGIQVSQSLLSYYDAYRDRDASVKRMSDRLEALSNSLQVLDETIQHRQFRSGETRIIAAIDSSLFKSEEYIGVLRKKCDKIRDAKAGDLRGSIVLAGSRIAYPFRKATLEKLDENIRAVQENLVLALNVLHLRDGQHLQDDAADIKRLTEVIFASHIAANVRRWLNAPDATINHNSNCAKRHPGTGSWFVRGPQFRTWLECSNSFLWMNGFAGSGKSVLCSTAVQHAFRRKDAKSNIAIACFYFTFTDQTKQDASAMLRALILQLSGQAHDGISELSSWYSVHKSGSPSNTVLLEHLQEIVQKFEHVYILLDALDEVPQGRSRRNALDTINQMQAWACPSLHILVTSRDEVDIRDRLPTERQTVVLSEATAVNEDIQNFVEGQLKTDTDLLKWKRHHNKIQNALTDKAHGIFRWVECQLEAIKNCPRSLGQLNECLGALPEDLDNTYERMLCNIKGQSARDAKRMLTALAFSLRPLSVAELIDMIAVDKKDCLRLDRQLRYEDVDSLLTVCPGMIQIYVPETNDRLLTQARARDDYLLSPAWEKHALSTGVVRISHFSVQEYLESSRIKQQKAHYFALDSAVAHNELAEICASYLLEPELAKPDLVEEDLEDLPLVDYAAKYWPKHYSKTAHSNSTAHDVAMKLFTAPQETFRNWVKIHVPETRLSRELHASKESFGSPLYYASFYNLPLVVQDLINSAGSEAHTREEKLDNAPEAASGNSHNQDAQTSLGSGTNVNARGGSYGTALVAASLQGHQGIVRLLLDNGADTSIQVGQWGDALQAASLTGYEEVVKLLLNKGANIEAPGGHSGSPLAAASFKGYQRVAKLLLDHGANPNFQGGHWGNALQAASMNGYDELASVLIDRGANVHNRGGFYDDALQAAAGCDHAEVVQILLDRGADINAQGEKFGTALQVACRRGHEQIVQILLDNGVDVNAPAGVFGNALQAASRGRYEQIVQLLLRHGAREES